MRKLRRGLSLLLCLLLTVGLLPTVAGAAAYQEDFDEMQVGTVPTGWVMTPENTEKAGAYVQALQSDAAANSMLLLKDDNPSAGVSRATRTFPASAAAELSFSYRMGSANGVNAIGLFSGGSASGKRQAGIGIFENSDGTGTVKHIGAAAWTAVSGVTIVPGVWYTIKLTVNGKENAVLSIDGTEVASFAVKGLSNVDRVIVQTNNAASVDDVFWVDDLTLTAGATSFTDTFDAIGSWVAEPEGLTDCGAWIVQASVAAGNALRVEDNTTSDLTRAEYHFAQVDSLQVEFDYLYESVGAANCFGLFNGGSASPNRLTGLGVFDNGDGTACLKYIDVQANGWKALPLTKLLPNTWYRLGISVTAESDTAELYLDGEAIAAIPITSTVTAVDRLIIQTSNAKGVGDVFWIDNVSLELPVLPTESPEAFSDSFDDGVLPEGYSGGTVSEGVLIPGGAVDRSLGTVASGRFGFSAKTEDLTALRFGLMAGGSTGIFVKADADGALLYQRGSNWYEFAEAGSVKAGDWQEIVIDLAPGRNTNYARVYVNDAYAGMAIYDNAFTHVTALRMDAPMVDDVWADASEGLKVLPERTEAAPTVYVPQVVESRAMLLAGDTEPASGALAYAEAAAVTLDTNSTSFGVDLGEKQRINALRVTSNKTGKFSSDLDDFAVWYSDDNAVWTKLQSYTYNSLTENGVRVALFEFSGVDARYVKVNTTSSAGSLTVNDLNTALRAERRMDRQWKLASQTMFSENGAPMTKVLRDKAVTLSEGMSIGVDLGLHSAVEAVELLGSGLYDGEFTLWYSLDNESWTEITDYIRSRDTRDSRDVLRFTFDSLTCGHVKLTAGAGVSARIDSLQQGIAAYSSREIASGITNYPGDRGAEGDFYTRPDGTLVMGFNGFEGSSGDFGNATLNARTSTDGGYTWGEDWVVAAKQSGSVNVMQSTYLWLDNGDLLLFHLEKETSSICNVYMRRSVDGGLTFGDPVLVTDEPQGYTITSSGNRALRLSNGRILLPVGYSAVVSDVYGEDRAVAYVWYSDDDGETWHRSRDAVTLPNAALEPSLALMDDGSLLMSLRTRSEGKIYQTVSHDNGDTWAQPEALTNMVTPSATNTVINVPATGDIALFWNNQFSTGNGSRTPLTVAVSADNGKTYQNVRNLLEIGSSVPWPAVAFYGRTVLVMYGSSTNVKILDVAELYQTTSGLVTTADLPKAATPEAVYADSLLTGVTADMVYSPDGGKTWHYAGGSVVELPRSRITADALLVKHNGSAAEAPSEVQTIALTVPMQGANMTLSNDLSLNFFVKQTDVTEGMYAEIVRAGKTTKVDFEAWMPNGNLYQIGYNGFAAKEMTEAVTVTIRNADGTAVSNTWTDSIRDYAMRMIAKDDTEAALKTTLVDMLNYGAEAQVFFNYNTDDLANSLLTDEQKAFATASVEMTDIRVKADGYIGSSLELETNILLKFVFDDDYAGQTAVVTYVDHYGREHSDEYVLTKNGDYATIAVNTLVVADCSVPVTVTVGEIEVVDSVESYCARMQLELCEPLMKFAASAKAYFK